MPLNIVCCILAICYVSQLAYCMPPGETHVGPFTSNVSEPFIVGGKPSSNWPWMVYVKTAGGRCGGSIINEEWVVTAAHCVEGALSSDVQVYTGVYDRKKDLKTAHVVSMIVIHEDYGNPNGYDNDIALLKMRTKLVGQVCLPEKDVSAGTPCIATGWGEGGADTLLREVSIDIRDASVCYKRFRRFNEALMICAGAAGVGICSGDSGGPLVYEEGGRYYLQGITSQNKGDCGEGEQIFVKVSTYVSWIKSKTGPLSGTCGVRPGGLSTGAIVGIVFGVLGGIALIGLIIYCVYKCREDDY